MVAAFLAAFPPYTIPTSASVPSASVPTNSRDSLTGKKKTHALANAGKSILNSLRGDRSKEEKEKEKEEKEKQDKPRELTIISSGKKDLGTLQEMKEALVQLGEVKKMLEDEITRVEQTLLDAFSGKTVEPLVLSPSVRAVLVATRPPKPVMDQELELAAPEAEEDKSKREKKSMRFSMDSLAFGKLFRQSSSSSSLEDPSPTIKSQGQPKHPLGSSSPSQNPSASFSSLNQLNQEPEDPPASLISASSSPMLSLSRSSSQLQEIVDKARLPTAGLVKDRKHVLRVQRACFLGSEFLEWMVANNQAKSRSEAQAIAQQMLASKLIVPLQSGGEGLFEDRKSLYRFDASSDPDEQGEDIDEELEKLFSHMVAEIELKSRKDYENKSHKNCFLSSQLIDWAMKNSHQPMDRAQALELAEKLRQKGYVKWVGRKTKMPAVSGAPSFVCSSR